MQDKEDTHWFGSSEHDESDLRESLARAAPLGERSRLLVDSGQLVAAAWWWKPDETTLVVDPESDVEAVLDELLPWLARSGARQVEALQQDQQLRDALARHHWEHFHSQFELMRDASPLSSPQWPDGVIATDLDNNEEAAYRVIYDEAEWAAVPGHSWRDFSEWRSLFIASEKPNQQVLAWENKRLVGVALGKTFSDGVGWVSQLAVARDQQGRGLGTALLREAFGRRLAEGAIKLGLGVSAANRDALRLYRSIGFDIDREWMTHRPTANS